MIQRWTKKLFNWFFWEVLLAYMSICFPTQKIELDFRLTKRFVLLNLRFEVMCVSANYLSDLFELPIQSHNFLKKNKLSLFCVFLNKKSVATIIAHIIISALKFLINWNHNFEQNFSKLTEFITSSSFFSY